MRDGNQGTGKADGAPAPVGDAAPEPAFGTAPGGAGRGVRLRAWLWRLRDRLVASRTFRNAAASFPLTRPMARRNARALFDLCAGFVYSQVLATCVRLDVFALLAERPRTAAEIGALTGLPESGADRLLAAAVSLRLADRRPNGRYGLGLLGAAVHGDPGIRAMIAHHHLLYDDLADPVPLLKGEAGQTRLGAYWAYAGRAASDADAPGAAIGADAVDAYSGLMAASQAMVVDEVVAAYPFRRHGHLLDVGGGDARFVAGVSAVAPALRLTVFDLPAVAERAQAALDRAGLARRAHAVGGDFTVDALPAGADLISLVRIVHDHDEPVVRALLSRAHDALASGGTLLIAEPMAETPGAEPVGDAYFGFYLLAMGSGRPRSRAHLTRLLEAAGFTDVREHSTRQPMIVRVLSARKQ
ncbi:hypothetical protein CCR85_12925 [Rhodothalassium salexigens]|uniref:methyltransferase n=1 Tax=Rhodothalassium salexigens TaxID=1086 RepID=UPI0019128FC1|nr:methyltransferase [Rhodothalassium salexigens]MBK5912388.1 hypothetical protein [Rhodothalassium salexigens]MBK5919992.1 hypothetical protein [Rhodothalassium salexigens]